MMKKVSVHCTASNRAFKLFVRSVVKSVQAYCRLAIASIATEHATSTSQRERSVLLSRGEVILHGVRCQQFRARVNRFCGRQRQTQLVSQLNYRADDGLDLGWTSTFDLLKHRCFMV